ncbi:MAG: hypothetical protein WBX50_03015 [Candidatus Deferrimicrobiaceae bacterium]
MKVDSLIAMRAYRGGGTFLGGFIALVAVATLFLAPAAARGAGPGGSGSVGKSSAVTFESIPGSTAKRVILSAKAAERLGIETGKVSEEQVVRKQMVGGRVIPPMEMRPKAKPAGGVFGGIMREAAAPAPKLAAAGFGGFGRVKRDSAPQPVAAAVPMPQPVATRTTSPAAGDVWVLVTLSPAEWDRLAKDKPARLLPLATREKLDHEVWAQPSGLAPQEDIKRKMLSLYYVVPGKDHGLTVNHRMRVELQLPGSDEKEKCVPYGAVYYDAKGAGWVYVSTKPLVFERRRVDVDRVVGDLAVLTDGPSVGTPVVTVGAALLYGAEIFGK